MPLHDRKWTELLELSLSVFKLKPAVDSVRLRQSTFRCAVGCALLVAAVGCDSVDDRPASFAYIYATVIQPNCTSIGCHNGFTATYDLELDTREGAYAALTGTDCAAGDEPPSSSAYVIPGQPDQSKLVHLLWGDDVPRRMPPDIPLPQRDIDLVAEWVLEGALCD